MKCTRSKLDIGQEVLGLVAPEELLSACCLVLPLVLSDLVSSCPFPSGLVLLAPLGPLGPLLGLSRRGKPLLGFTPGAPWASS